MQCTSRMTRWILAVSCAAAMWLTGAVALACGTTAPSYSTIKTIAPPDGTTGFPLDGTVRVELLDHWVDANGGHYSPPFHLTVTRIDSGEVVPGAIDGLGGVSPTWRSDEPLSANTQYRVEVTTVDEVDSNYDGPVTATSTFTTGDAPSPPIAFEGELTIAAIRRDAAQHCTVVNDCNQCMPDGTTAQVLYADLDLPKVSGGFAAYGYDVTIAPTTADGEPFASGYPGVSGSQPLTRLGVDGTPPSWSVLLAPLGHPYAPCFELSVIDSLGHEQSTSVCLDRKIDVEALLRSGAGVIDIGAKADAGSFDPYGEISHRAHEPRRTVADDYSRKADCSATPTPGARSPVIVAPAALVWLALRSRRRKRALQA